MCVAVDGRGGSYLISIGTATGNSGGLDGINKRVIVDGGYGEKDVLMVIDTDSSQDKSKGTMTSFSITGLMGIYTNETIEYSNFEDVIIDLSQGRNEFLVNSTAPSPRRLSTGKARTAI
jgi:hypothetical protein